MAEEHAMLLNFLTNIMQSTLQNFGLDAVKAMQWQYPTSKYEKQFGDNIKLQIDFRFQGNLEYPFSNSTQSQI